MFRQLRRSDSVFYCLFALRQGSYIVQAGLELLILSTTPPKCRDKRIQGVWNVVHLKVSVLCLCRHTHLSSAFSLISSLPKAPFPSVSSNRVSVSGEDLPWASF